jgi:predicted phosphodiesterase
MVAAGGGRVGITITEALFPMKIALIADIHGNLGAFDAVLAEITREQPDQIVCLGDVAAEGPQPHEVLVRLGELGCPVVLGNADAELLDLPAEASAENEDARKILEISRWGAEQLDDADKAFIASFRPIVEIDLGAAGTLLCCHGSPRSFDDVIRATTPDDELTPMMAGTAAMVQAGGHTHIRMLRSWRGREIVNPGSVGLAYQFFPDGSARVPPWAEFAMLTADDGAVSLDFRRVAYDRDATVRAMVERGMPHAAWWSADWR